MCAHTYGYIENLWRLTWASSPEVPLCRDSTWHWLMLVNFISKQGFFVALPEMRDGFTVEGRKVGAMVLGDLFCLFAFLICLWFSFSNCVGRWTWSLKVEKENSSFRSALQKSITEKHNLSIKKHSNNTGYSLGPSLVLAQTGVKQEHTISAISLSNFQPRQASSNPKVTSKHY